MRDHRTHLRPYSERFCDVTLTVKFYCDCDVAKSLRMGPLLAYYFTCSKFTFSGRFIPLILDTQPWEEGSNITTCVPGIIAFCRCPLLSLPTCTTTAIPIGVQLCGNNQYYRMFPWTSFLVRGCLKLRVFFEEIPCTKAAATFEGGTFHSRSQHQLLFTCSEVQRCK